MATFTPKVRANLDDLVLTEHLAAKQERNMQKNVDRINFTQKNITSKTKHTTPTLYNYMFVAMSANFAPGQIYAHATYLLTCDGLGAKKKHHSCAILTTEEFYNF